MRERPILFNGEMVRAILAGQKTQTRRVIKPQPTVTESGAARWGTHDGPQVSSVPRRVVGGNTITMVNLIGEYCPYGAVGDRLWVRETFACVHGSPEHTAPHATDVVVYRADGGAAAQVIASARAWKPSIFMPRAYSRLALEITSVRVQRVRDISEMDACKEGIPPWTNPNQTFNPVVRFGELWDSINEKRGYGWESNPWVWALTFRPV